MGLEELSLCFMYAHTQQRTAPLPAEVLVSAEYWRAIWTYLQRLRKLTLRFIFNLDCLLQQLTDSTSRRERILREQTALCWTNLVPSIPRGGDTEHKENAGPAPFFSL